MKIQLCIIGINYILKQKSIISNCNNISQYNCFLLYFLSNKSSLEHRDFKKNQKKTELNFSKPLTGSV